MPICAPLLSPEPLVEGSDTGLDEVVGVVDVVVDKTTVVVGEIVEVDIVGETDEVVAEAPERGLNSVAAEFHAAMTDVGHGKTSKRASPVSQQFATWSQQYET